MRHAVRSLGMSGRARGGGGTAPLIDATAREFQPQDVPEVSNGYWWEPANAIGFGTTSFRVREGNGHSTFDLVQATVASQPTVLTENGGQQFRMRPTTDGAPAFAVTSGAVARGWTTATGFLGWFRLPSNGGTAGSSTALLQHSGAAGSRGINVTASISSLVETMAALLSLDGTANGTVRCASPFVGAGWHFCETYFDPLFVLGGSLAADRVKFFVDFVSAPIIQTASTLPASLNNASTPLAIGCFTTQAPFVTTDFSFAALTNGIPSLANRVRLANRRNPTGILLAA